MTNEEIALRGTITGLQSSASIYRRAYENSVAGGDPKQVSLGLMRLSDATEHELNEARCALEVLELASAPNTGRMS